MELAQMFRVVKGEVGLQAGGVVDGGCTSRRRKMAMGWGLWDVFGCVSGVFWGCGMLGWGAVFW